MKKFISFLAILLLITGGAFLTAQDQPSAPVEEEAPVTEAPAEEAPAPEAQPEEAPVEQASEAQPEEGQLGAGGEPKVANPYINLNFLSGQSVTDNAGAEVGTIQDAFFTSDGNVSHVIANIQNAPGVEQGTYLFPLDYFTIDQTQVKLNLPASPQFQQVPGAKSAGIIANDSVQASKLMQFDLVDDQGRNLGTIEDVVINMQDGTISYVAVNFAELLGAEEKLFAVPYSEIWYNLDAQTVTIYNINQNVLEQKQGISAENWPETADPNWNKAQ